MSDIALKVKVDSSGAVSGLHIATSSVEEATALMRAGLAGVAPAAKHASEEIGGLSEVIKEYGQSQRSEGRMGRFLAADLASMGIASKGAAGELTGLVSAFALGGGIGAGIEAVKMGIEFFTSFGEEAKKAEEAVDALARKVSGELADAFKKIRDEVEDAGKTKTEMAWLGQVRKGNEEIAKLQVEINKIVKEGPGFWDTVGTWFAEGNSKSGSGKLAMDKAIEKLQEKQNTIRETLEAGKANQGITQEAEDKTDFTKIESELAKARAKEVEANAILFEEYLKQDAAKAKAHQKFIEEQSKAEYEAAVAITKMLKEQDDERLKDEERKEKAQIKILEEKIKMSERFGSAMGNTLTQLAEHHISLGKAMAEVANQGVRVVADMVSKQILAYAEKASAAAFANNVDDAPGPYGYILAAGAAAAAFGAVEAMLSGVPSASGGFDIPHNINPMTQLHGGEMVLPAHIADPLRENLANGGAGGGGDTNIHFNAPVDRGWWDANQGHVVRVIQTAQRNGRL